MRIGLIDNRYGYLIVKEDQGRFYWSITDCSYHGDSEEGWEEIPKSLYDELIKFEKER